MNDSPGMTHLCAEFTQHDVLDDDTTELDPSVVELPMLASLEAKVATQWGTCVCHLTEKAAATRESESSFIPLTPEKRKEGESLTNTESDMVQTPRSENTARSDNTAADNLRMDQQLRTLWLYQESLGINIWAELQGKYIEDPFFQVILEKHKELRNFENKGNLIYLKRDDKHILGIIKVLINRWSA